MPDLTTWGTVEEWCATFRIKPEWIVGWKLWTSEVAYPGKKYSSLDITADEIADDTHVQGLKIWHTRPEALGDIPARPQKLYAYGMTGRDIYWIPGATRPKYGIYVSDEDDRKFFLDLSAEAWDG